VPSHPPKSRAIPLVPKGDPFAQAPPARASRVPKQHAVGAPPNPRQPELVRDVHGGTLKDLFELFPDLPRPPRPTARVRSRVMFTSGKPRTPRSR
jgi:hypothetical protein